MTVWAAGGCGVSTASSAYSVVSLAASVCVFGRCADVKQQFEELEKNSRCPAEPQERPATVRRGTSRSHQMDYALHWGSTAEQLVLAKFSQTDSLAGRWVWLTGFGPAGIPAQPAVERLSKLRSRPTHWQVASHCRGPHHSLHQCRSAQPQFGGLVSSVAAAGTVGRAPGPTPAPHPPPRPEWWDSYRQAYVVSVSVDVNNSFIHRRLSLVINVSQLVQHLHLRSRLTLSLIRKQFSRLSRSARTELKRWLVGWLSVALRPHKP